MAGILDIPGYGAFLQKGQLNQQQAMGELQGVLGQISAMQNMQQMQHQRAMQPLQQQMLQAQMTEAQRNAATQQQMAADRANMTPLAFVQKWKPEIAVPLLIREEEKKKAQQDITGLLGVAETPAQNPQSPMEPLPGEPQMVPGRAAIPGVLDTFKNSPIPQIRNQALAIEQLAGRGGYEDRKDFNADVAKLGTLDLQHAERRRAETQAQEDRLERERQRASDQRALREFMVANRPPPGVHPTLIRDKNDPTKNVVVDARTGRIIGDGPTVSDSRKAGIVQNATAAFDRDMKPLQDTVRAADRYWAAKETGDNAQAMQIAASALLQMSRTNNQRFKGEAPAILGGGYQGGSLTERIANFASQLSTGTPSAQTQAQLDALVESMTRATAEDYAERVGKHAVRAKGRGVDVVEVTGGPRVLGRYVVTPDGQIKAAKTRGDAMKAAKAWMEENGGE